MRNLWWDLDALAVDTWERIERGDRRGLRLREDTITEVNLLELDRRHPQLNVHRFNQSVEKSVGADWEWFIGTGNLWLCLRVQAKRMDGDEYRQLQHGGDEGDDYQYDTLLRVAQSGASSQGPSKATVPTFAYYVFFNGWPAWPTGVPWHGCPNGAKLPHCSHAGVKSFGCAAMPAALLKVIHGGRGAAGRKVAEYLPYSIPWTWLFGTPTPSAAALAASGMLNATHLLPSSMNPGDASPWMHGGSTWPLGTSEWAMSPLAPQVASVEDIYLWHRAVASVSADVVSAQGADESDRPASALVEFWQTVGDRYDSLPRTAEGLAPLPPYAEAVRRLADDRYAESDGDGMQALLRFATELDGPLDVIVTDLGRPTA